MHNNIQMEFQILDSIPDLSCYKSFTDRYFTKRYHKDAGGVKNNDIMIMYHSNRIALMSLAPNHFFFKKDVEYKINFHVGKNNRLANSVRGKGKKGGQQLHPNTVLCRIEYADGTEFAIPCGIKGTLIEINEELVKNNKLLKEFPDSNGFIAIILSTINNADSSKSTMMTHEEYIAKIKANDVE